jgi:hypothetical protein
MGWDDQTKTLSSSDFLKFKDGQTEDLHILNDEPRKEIFHGFAKTKSVCSGEGCELCANAKKPEDKAKERWVTNVLLRSDGTVKKWEFGWSVMRQIKDIAEMLNEGGQSITDVDLRVKATGEKMEREYTVMQKVGGPVPVGLKLHTL